MLVFEWRHRLKEQNNVSEANPSIYEHLTSDDRASQISGQKGSLIIQWPMQNLIISFPHNMYQNQFQLDMSS